MKIKDIMEIKNSSKKKVSMALRIYACEPEVKDAIKRYRQTGNLPLVSVDLKSPDGNVQVTLTTFELADIYAYDELSSLLMIDDFIKAVKAENYVEINRLLGTLSSGRHITSLPVTDEILETVREKYPDVWKEYLKISQMDALEDEGKIKEVEELMQSEL